MGILSRFSEYQVGKQKLIDYRRGHNDNEFVEQVITKNLTEKKQYEDLIQRIKIDLKRQIKATILTTHTTRRPIHSTGRHHKKSV